MSTKSFDYGKLFSWRTFVVSSSVLDLFLLLRCRYTGDFLPLNAAREAVVFYQEQIPGK